MLLVKHQLLLWQLSVCKEYGLYIMVIMLVAYHIRTSEYLGGGGITQCLETD